MTPEQKAKAYDEAIKKAESLYKASEPMSGCNVIIETLFPELKESEDEKIRKAIIEGLREMKSSFHTISSIKIDDAIAWLEKQEGCEYIKKDWLEHIKQSWYKEGFIDGKYSGGTSKEWTINDAATLKELIDFLENGTAKLQHDLALYASWLKRKFYPSEKQGEQKSADNVGQKFHEGEWITNGDYTWKIVEVKPLDYILQSQDGNVVDDTISHVDEQFHSFTIEDAKDGDVLVCNINKAEIGGDIEKLPNITPTICVYQNVVKDKDYIHTYFSLYNGSSLVLSNSMYYNTFVYNIHPATKKQRNLLFQKMKEAGYEWDDEKKELKKISQRMVSAEAKEALYDKHTWSEEDEKITNALNNDPYVITADKIKQASKILLDKARKYYNEKNLEVELGLLNEFSHVDYWKHKGYSKSDKELEGEGPKLQVVDFDRQLQWEKEKIINKACEWLREHKDYVATEDNGISGWIPERFIEDFKEYMNENS